MAFVNVTNAGPEKAVILFVWEGELVPRVVFAIVARYQAGEEMFAKFLDALVLVKIVLVTAIVMVAHTSVRVIPAGQVSDAIFQTVREPLTVICVELAMPRSLLLSVRIVQGAGWDPHVRTRARLGNRFQWTVDSVFAGQGTQVITVILLCSCRTLCTPILRYIMLYIS